MALLLTCQSISKSFFSRPLFENLSFTISESDRLGLIGPNGSGKTTLLQIMAGLQEPDAGTLSQRKLLRIGYVAQDSIFPEGPTVRQVLEEALKPFHIEEMESKAKVSTILGVAGFADPDAPASTLSGGWRKRLALSQALVTAPDILLLDEPTNHLDLDGILWLERLLKSSTTATVIVSHDRYFLENVSTSMAELNRVYPEGVFRVEGNYSRFLEKRAEYQLTQEKLEESLATKVKREVAWLQRGAKARTTKSKARIDSAGKLIEELGQVSARLQTSSAKIDFTASDRKTKKLIEAIGISCVLGGRTLFEKLNLRLSPGMRLGLAGANGSGKTTLLRLIHQQMEPTTGVIERADNLRIVYFDQNREILDPEISLRRALAPDGDSVIYRDRVVHVTGWAKRFLFHPEQLEVAVGRLSGGERARVQIARLMLQPADLLLLDEPTNDLDIPTLEVLEESLCEFPGAMVLVTHDRYLLDKVSTTVLGLDGAGGAQIFADYLQWEQWQTERKPAKAQPKEIVPPPPTAKKRLSYIETRELAGIEQKIHDAEAALENHKQEMNQAAAAAESARLQQSYEAMLAAQQEVDRLYARWSELEAKQDC